MKLFIDAFYLTARTHPHDHWHDRVNQIAKSLPSNVRYVTTYEVLTEYLSAMAGQGAKYRHVATQTVRTLLEDPDVRVFPQSPDLFHRGLQRYESRSDKGYSLVDCISMVVMEQQGMTEVLTNDHHFEQEGFVILIRK
jgi:uncharacterized protein